MAFKKYNENFWYILISVLLIILILLIIVFIYIYNNNIPKNIKNTDNIIIIKEQKDILDDIPIYPKNLPKYNNTTYQQVGVLTSDEYDKDPIVLPLFSRKLNNNNDRYNYYTATDNNNMMRLPIKFDNMNCEDDIGCREIYNNDKISIEIYKGRIFTASIYKIDSPKYFADKY